MQSSPKKLIYFSGIDRPTFVKLLASEKARAMISPPQKLFSSGMQNALIENQMQACCDSGAFQGKTNVEKYAKYIQQAEQSYPLDWYANLDVIGDSRSSHRNYEALLNLLPLSLHSKVLWIYQGGDRSLLQQVCSHSDYIGIGGLVPLASSPMALRAYLEGIADDLLNFNTKVHLFGVNGVKSLKWASIQPWFRSADSTAWMYGWKSTEIFTSNGDRVRQSQLGLMLNREERSRNNIRVIQSFLNSSFYQADLFDSEAA